MSTPTDDNVEMCQIPAFQAVRIILLRLMRPRCYSPYIWGRRSNCGGPLVYVAAQKSPAGWVYLICMAGVIALNAFQVIF